MNIQGLQKLSLLDYPGKICCTVFTGGCNLRCPFCHNASLVIPDKLDMGCISVDTVLTFLKKRQKVLDAVCITGGEPLLEKGLEGFIKQAKDMGYLIKLDTNGTFPQRLKALAKKGLLDYVAMDIKNSLSKYSETVGISDFDTTDVEESVRYLLTGSVDYEFRTTVVREFHDKNDLIEIAKWLMGAKKYFLQNFVDSGDLIEKGLTACSKDEMIELKEAVSAYLPDVKLRGL